MTVPSVPRPAATVRAAERATYIAFGGSGLAFSSWASRIPQVRDQLHLSPSALGLVLLAVAGGSICALPLSGHFVARLGSSRTITAMSLLLAAGLTVAAIGSEFGIPPVVVGLVMLGFGNGAWDVAMNVQGAVVERHLGRSVLSRFHAGFSLGTVAGALLGAAMVALGVPVSVHLIGIAVVVGITVPLAVRGFLPDHDETEEQSSDRKSEHSQQALQAWTEPRTLLIGVFVLAFAFAEGTGNDWISVAVIDGYHAADALGTLGFAVFLAAMTTGRWFGPALLDRYGRVPVVRGLSILAVAGLALFVFGGSTPVAFVGSLLWGAGVSLGFPVGMSAGADDPVRAASRVSVIASIGYCAFLAGPPMVGFLGDHYSVLKALTSVAVLLALATLVAGATRPLPSTAEEDAPDARVS